MNIAPIAINAAEQLVMSESFWFHCKKFVQDIDGHNHLSNEEKHQTVVNDLVIIFGDLGETLFKIGIGIAVTWLKAQSATAEN